MSLNVSLPPELENRVRQHVESGLYSSASEVIREALRLFEAYQGVQASTPYIVFYFVDAHGITIARVLHHTRDVPTIEHWPQH
jgi:metal-responsive CopG/Arc/MetJ family transcriptional regulator